MAKLVSAKQMVDKAYKGKYAVPQFNINNLEWVKAMLETCQELKSPVILGVSEGAAKYMGGFKTIVGMVTGMMDGLKTTIPVAIHLDHGTTVENCKKAIDAGFTSVMYDGSHEKIAKNVANTKIVVAYAKKKKVSVEAEVGTVGGNEDGIVGGISYAKLEEVVAIAKTGVDMVAASLGSVHGHYVGKPKLGFDEMKTYSAKIKKPLVLHGGSGIPDDMIKKAIASGESKINVNTEIQEGFAKGVREYITKGLDKKGSGFDPRKLLSIGCSNMKAVAAEKIKLFGSNNKG